MTRHLRNIDKRTLLTGAYPTAKKSATPRHPARAPQRKRPCRRAHFSRTLYASLASVYFRCFFFSFKLKTARNTLRENCINKKRKTAGRVVRKGPGDCKLPVRFPAITAGNPTELPSASRLPPNGHGARARKIRTTGSKNVRIVVAPDAIFGRFRVSRVSVFRVVTRGAFKQVANGPARVPIVFHPKVPGERRVSTFGRVANTTAC